VGNGEESVNVGTTTIGIVTAGRVKPGAKTGV
jgi:hypothetical protein